MSAGATRSRLTAVPGWVEAEPCIVDLHRASTIQPEPIRWLWPGWLARGKLHLLAGRPGCGKTTLALGLAATLSVGGRWPDGTRAEAGDTVIWSGEDDPADTLVPRLLAAGADPRRVHFVGDVGGQHARRPFDPATDMALLARTLEHVKPALLILDPVVSAVPGDSHKGAEVRRALQPVVDLAAALDCAVLGVTHLGKNTAGREPTERLLGSVAFAAVARVVLLATKREDPPPGEPARLLVRSKSNIGDDSGGIGYDLHQVEAAPGVWASRVEWGGTVEGCARELLAQAEATPDDEDGGALGDAVGFLRALLEDGPTPAKRVRGEADGAGHSWATIRRAARRLRVEVVRSGFGRGGQWMWSLPAESIDAQTSPKVPTQKNLSTYASMVNTYAPDAGGPPAADFEEAEL